MMFTFVGIGQSKITKDSFSCASVAIDKVVAVELVSC